jgi:hypothetical protein
MSRRVERGTFPRGASRLVRQCDDAVERGCLRLQFDAIPTAADARRGVLCGGLSVR